MRVGLAGTLAAAACAAALAVAPAGHAGDIQTVTATPFGGAFDTPVHVTGAPGFPDLVYVTQQGGQVRVVEDGVQLEKPLIDLTDLVSFGGEQGLLSTAFPPDFAETGRFYVYYTNKKCNDATGGCDIEIAEFKLRERQPAPRSAQLAPDRNHHPPPRRREPQRRHRGVRPRRQALDRHGRRRRRKRHVRQLEQAERAPRKAPADQPEEARARQAWLPRSGEEPVRGRKGKGRDLVDRPS